MKKSLAYYIELAARLHVFFLLNIYGWGKLLGGQFYRKGNLPPEVAAKTLAEVNSFELGWTFMGHSYGYILFVGISQIIGAWLLLWERTKLIGVAILLPILTNIVVFDIIFLDKYGALASACLYLALLLVILYLNRVKIIEVIGILTRKSRVETVPGFQKLKAVGLALLIFGAMFTVEQFLVTIIGH